MLWCSDFRRRGQLKRSESLEVSLRVRGHRGRRGERCVERDMPS